MAPKIRIIDIDEHDSAIIEIVIHFGINPVSGGIPLSDRRIRGMVNWYMGELLINLFDKFLFTMFFMYIIINIGLMIAEYTIK